MADQDQSVGEVRDQALAEVGGDSFHTYTGDDGKVQSWKTPDELNSFIKKSGMFQADYTRKSQTREAEYRKRMEELDKKEAEWKKQREAWEKTEKAKYDRYNEALSKRPQIAAQLARMVDQPTSPDEIFTRSQSYADQKYSTLEQRLSQFEQKLEEERLEKERDMKFAELETEIPDFDRNVVTEALQTLDAGDMKSLMAMIWKANQYNPAAMQEKVEQNIARKKGAGMVPSGGGPPPKNSGSTNPRTAREEAMEEYARS